MTLAGDANFTATAGSTAHVLPFPYRNGAGHGHKDLADAAERLLALYHETAKGVPDAVFVLTCIVPARHKGAKEPVNPQKFRIGDAKGMADETRSRGNHSNVYFGPTLMRRALPAGQRGTEADIIAVLSVVIEEDGDTGKRVTLPPGVKPSFEVATSRNPTLNRHFHFVFDKPLPPNEAKDIAELAYRKCGGDSGGKDITHVWRIPQTLNFPDWRKIARGRPEAPQPVELIGGTGAFVRVDALRAALESMPDRSPRSEGSTAGTEWQSGGSDDRDEILARLSPALRAGMNEEGQDRSSHCFFVMCSMFEAGLTDDEILIVAQGAPFARKFAERGDLDDEIRRARARWGQKHDQGQGQEQGQQEQAKRTFNWGDYFKTKELPDDEKARLNYLPGREARMVDEALACIRAFGGIYERSPEYPEIVHPCEEGMRAMNEAWLRDWLSRHVSYTKFDARKKEHVPCNVPKDTAALIIARKTGRELPYLRGVITAPTMRPDGTILDKPGYDPATELLLVTRKSEELVPVNLKPANPAETYKRAFQTIWRPFRMFPFVEPYDRGVMLAGVLTAAVRRVLPTAPGFVKEAAMAGSGKTKLGSSLAELMGGVPTVLPHTTNEEEMRKRLLSAQRSGEPCIFIDNVEGDFESCALAAFLTQSVYGDRILGVSEMSKLPTNMLFIATGNNINIGGDLWRRVLRCRIDPQTDAPDERKFNFDPVLYCRQRRQSIISSALTLLHGFVRAGRPKISSNTMGSFEDWDALVRQCVLWIDENKYAGKDDEGKDIKIGDPYESVRQAKAENPQIEIRKTVLECMGRLYPGDKDFTAADAIARAREADDLLKEDENLCKIELRDALHDIAAAGAKNFKSLSDNSARTAIGKWLSKNTNFYGSGFVLKKVERGYASGKVQRYRVEQANGNLTSQKTGG